LGTFFDYFDRFDRFVCVGELLERLATLGISDSLSPFAEVAVDEFLHLSLHVGANTQLVVDDDFLQVVNSTWQVLDPAGSSLQLVGSSNVEDQVAIDNGHHHLGGYIRNEQLRVPRLCTTVTSDIDIEAFVGRDKTEAAIMLVLGWSKRY
jgi:hypothetical protein